MIWACFLHFYQPPTQKKYWIDRITDEAYRRLIKGLLENPQAKVTLNINSILCELWEQNGHGDVLEGLKALLQRGQIELTGSAKFHPLLPKLPKEMIIRQIKLNDETHRRFFGDLYRPRGFFPPEMAYDRNLAQIVADLGFEWIIAEELSLGKAVDYTQIYEVAGIEVKGSGQNLKIYFRDRAFSYKILAGYLGTEKLFVDELQRQFASLTSDHYLLTAMDGETFGHHRPGMERLLFNLFVSQAVEMVHLSDLPSRVNRSETVETVPSTWALMEHEVERKLPFARWDDPENRVHQLQWQLTNLAIAAVENSKHQIPSTKQIQNFNNQKGFEIWDLKFGISDLNAVEKVDVPNEVRSYLKSQSLLDRALHSDQYWWASAKPWWSIEYIERGAKELLESIRFTGDQKAFDQAQKLYYQILETAFDYQRSGKVDEISRQEDETIRMRTDQTLPKMPKEELLKIIETIREEMLAVAQNQEYERAAQLRDRIKELEGYLS